MILRGGDISTHTALTQKIAAQGLKMSVPGPRGWDAESWYIKFSSQTTSRGSLNPLGFVSGDSLVQNGTERLQHLMLESSTLSNWSRSTQNPGCNKHRATASRRPQQEFCHTKFYYFGSLPARVFQRTRI